MCSRCVLGENGITLSELLQTFICINDNYFAGKTTHGPGHFLLNGFCIVTGLLHLKYLHLHKNMFNAIDMLHSKIRWQMYRCTCEINVFVLFQFFCSSFDS